MTMLKFIKDYINTRKKVVKKLNKANNALFSDLKTLDEYNNELKSIISNSQIALNQAYTNTRELYLAPGEFVIGNGIPEFKSIKILIGDEDITKKVSKIVVSGVNFIELE